MARPSTGQSNVIKLRLSDELKGRIEGAAKREGIAAARYMRDRLDEAVNGVSLAGIDRDTWDEVVGFLDFGGQSVGALVQWLDEMILDGTIRINDSGFSIQEMA